MFRHIYVAMKEVGHSKIFHDEKDIAAIFNVIKPCSNHEHSSYMAQHMKEWFISNMQYVCLQMFDSIGNIVIFCNGGRSRSPMYVVAYLFFFSYMTLDEAMSCIEDLLKERDQSMDRHSTLYEIIVTMAERV